MGCKKNSVVLGSLLSIAISTPVLTRVSERICKIPKLPMTTILICPYEDYLLIASRGFENKRKRNGER